ncbi:MAG: AraC family transcriptional regulator [Acidobacteriia bacterium]|nr:AraC family transcriptional regulator [Terriglobia bacterium]
MPSSFLENQQLVGPLSSVPRLLTDFGADPEEVLSAAGLHPRALDNPQGTIAFSAAGLLLKVAAEKTACPDFGLRVGEQIRTTSLGLVGELMRNAPTVGVAMRDFAVNQHRNAHGSVSYLYADERRAFFGYAVYQPNVPGHELICDCAAMGAFQMVCELVGVEHRHAIEVLLCRSEPEDMAPYHRAFAVKLHFNAEQTALLVPKGVLSLPVKGADADRRAVLIDLVAKFSPAGPLDVETQLRRALRVALIAGNASANEVAAQIGMSRRTLHRRLDEIGLHFQDVLDETRCEYAKQLLAHTQLGIGEIAGIVGYADPSVLTRGFLRWMGLPPSEWRSSHWVSAASV